MTTDIIIHATIFIVVFTIAGIWFSRKNRNKTQKSEDIIEVEAEIYDIDKMKQQAAMDYERAKTALEEATRIKRSAAEETAVGGIAANPQAPQFRSPYEILGVRPTDSMEKITEVYQSLLEKFDPDKNEIAVSIPKPQKTILIDQIQKAYAAVLSQQSKTFGGKRDEEK